MPLRKCNGQREEETQKKRLLQLADGIVLDTTPSEDIGARLASESD